MKKILKEKKILSLFLMIVLSVTILVGCGSNDKKVKEVEKIEESKGEKEETKEESKEVSKSNSSLSLN